MANHRAWRFEFQTGEPEPGRGGIGLSKVSEGVAMVSGADSIRQAILLLLSTEPGERIMRPDYGCPLRHLLFSSNDETTAGLIIHFVRRAILHWEPRVIHLQVSARQHTEEPGALEITIRYHERSTGRVDEIVYPVFLEGERL